MASKRIGSLVVKIKDVASKLVRREHVDVAIAYYLFLLYRNRSLDPDYQLRYGELMGKVCVPENVESYLNSYGLEKGWPDLAGVLREYEDSDFLEAIGYVAENFVGLPDRVSTPDSIADLAAELLNVKKGDLIVDLGCGCCGFFSRVASRVRRAKLFGIDSDLGMCALSEIRADLLRDNGHDVCIRNADVLDKLGGYFSSEGVHPCNKVFASLPLGGNLRPVGEKASWGLSLLQKKLNFVGRLQSLEWLYAGLAWFSMGDNGRCVCLMSSASMWKENDEDIRKSFVDEGYVEAVVELPNDMVRAWNLNLCLIVFSNKGRKGRKVRLVDARGMGQVKARTNILSSVDVNAIVRECTEGGLSFTAEELRECGYNLLASRVQDKRKVLCENASSKPGAAQVRLGDVCEISRGTAASQKTLEKAFTEGGSGVKYLMSTDIKDGEIDVSALPCYDLSKVPECKINKRLYCAKNKTIVLSRNGFPCKIAVVNLSEGEEVLVNSNLYMLDVDQTKADPDYVKLFLGSYRGFELLEKTFVGGMVQSMDQKALANVVLSLPPLEEQRTFVSVYMKEKASVDELKSRWVQAHTKLKLMVDAEVE